MCTVSLFASLKSFVLILILVLTLVLVIVIVLVFVPVLNLFSSLSWFSPLVTVPVLLSLSCCTCSCSAHLVLVLVLVLLLVIVRVPVFVLVLLTRDLSSCTVIVILVPCSFRPFSSLFLFLSSTLACLNLVLVRVPTSYCHCARPCLRSCTLSLVLIPSLSSFISMHVPVLSLCSSLASSIVVPVLFRLLASFLSLCPSFSSQMFFV